MKKAINIFDLIEEVNKDLGEDLLVAVVPENDISVYVMVADKKIGKQQKLIISSKYDMFTKKDDILHAKKRIVSVLIPFGFISLINPYEQFLSKAKQQVSKIRNFLKTKDYLESRYGIEFGHYACMGNSLDCFVVFPKLECRMNPMFKFATYYSLLFDGDKISEKSLKSYCRKMDKVITRMKCLSAAFDNCELMWNGKNFYKHCTIKRSGFGDWIIKFPYIDKYFAAQGINDIKKLIKIYHYKDTDYCIWRGSTPEEFTMMRELLK